VSLNTSFEHRLQTTVQNYLDQRFGPGVHQAADIIRSAEVTEAMTKRELTARLTQAFATLPIPRQSHPFGHQ
jgi:hypothetical protein